VIGPALARNVQIPGMFAEAGTGAKRRCLRDILPADARTDRRRPVFIEDVVQAKDAYGSLHPSKISIFLGRSEALSHPNRLPSSVLDHPRQT